MLEEDGTEIDDDELLRESVGSRLMILQKDEKWLSESAQGKQVQTAEEKTTDKGNKLTLPENSIVCFNASCAQIVPEICPQNKYGDDRISGGFWVNM